MINKDKARDKFYLKLEEELIPSTSDERIQEILSGFNKEDYLKVPIIFDLIIGKRFKILSHLYENNVPFSYSEWKGNALHVACGRAGSFEAVKFLYERNIFTDINAKTDEGETPFLLAIMYEHEDILKYFLKKAKPDLSLSTIYKETAFSLAKKTNNKEIISLLENYIKNKF